MTDAAPLLPPLRARRSRKTIRYDLPMGWVMRVRCTSQWHWFRIGAGFGVETTKAEAFKKVTQ